MFGSLAFSIQTGETRHQGGNRNSHGGMTPQRWQPYGRLLVGWF